MPGAALTRPAAVGLDSPPLVSGCRTACRAATREVPELTASGSTDLELMRASQLLESDPAAAARRARDILAASPAHPEASLLLATASRRLGDPQKAVAVLESLAHSHANSPLMQLDRTRIAIRERGGACRKEFRRADSPPR